MAGPCLPNLYLLRLVNFSLGSLGLSAFPQAFFSLHYASHNEREPSDINEKIGKTYENDLLYVSQTIPVSARLNFGVVSLPTLPHRTFQTRVQIWVSSSDEHPTFELYYDLFLDVRNLVLLDRAICDQEGDKIFTENAIIWQFDGLDFCLRSHIHGGLVESILKPFPGSERGLKHPKLSYTVDDVRHMSSLIVGLRDFHEIKAKTSADIDALESCNGLSFSILKLDELDRLQASIAKLDEFISRQQSANEALEAQILLKRTFIKRILHVTKEDFSSFKSLAEEKQEIIVSQISPLLELLAGSVYPHILSSTRHIVSIVIDAFPIDLAEDSDHYCISGIEFPSSIKEILSVCYNETPALKQKTGVHMAAKEPGQEHLSLVDCVNAGLSEIVAASNVLSLITGIPLKYEITFDGSQSYLNEHLSPQQVVSNNRNMPVEMHVSTTVKYPLFYDIEQAGPLDGVVLAEGQKHPRNVRFERGLALLNRNLTVFIAELANMYDQLNTTESLRGSFAHNIPLDCVDNFLWNLHYLMLFITAPSE